MEPLKNGVILWKKDCDVTTSAIPTLFLVGAFSNLSQNHQHPSRKYYNAKINFFVIAFHLDHKTVLKSDRKH